MKILLRTSIFTAIIVATSANAGDIATERTQLATSGLVTAMSAITAQVAGIVQQVRDFEETAGRLLEGAARDLLPIDDIFAVLDNVETIMNAGNEMSHTYGEVENFMRGRFDTYDNYLQAIRDDGGIIRESFETRFRQWNTGHRNAIRQVMTSHNFHASQIDTQEARLNTLRDLSTTAGGRMQAAQVGHEIAIEQVKQIQELRSIIMEQSTMHASFFAHKQAMEAEAAAATEYITEIHQAVPIDDGMAF